MTYTTRTLPSGEWPGLGGTELARLVPYLDPAQTRIVVVEHGGVIVASWAVLTMQHLEGAWIHPAYRGNPSVVRRLLAATFGVVRALGARYAWTGAQTDEIRTLIRKLHGDRIAMDAYVIPIPPREAVS